MDCDEYCDICGQSPPDYAPELYECPQCGKYVCCQCCGGINTLCFDCEEIQDGRMVGDLF